MSSPSTTATPTSSSSSTTTTKHSVAPAATTPLQHHPERDSYEYALLSGLAGGIAGCVAKTSVAPLDRVKILFQTRSPDYQRYAGTWTGVFRASKDIYAETGIRGLLQGHSATLLRIFPYAAIKFMAYEKFHIILMPTPEAENGTRRFLAGSMAGVTSAVFTYPLELIRVRLAFETHHDFRDRSSLLRTIRQIYLEPPIPLKTGSGTTPNPSTTTSPATTSSAASTPTLRAPSLANFYRGIFPTLIGIVPYAGTSFFMWGLLKRDLLPAYLSPSTLSRHRTFVDLFAGGLAGAIGQTAAYPLDIVRRRMQVGPALYGGQRGRAGFWDTAKGVYTGQGWRGFFVGLSIGYLKVIPLNAVSFTTWQGMKGVLGLEDRR